MTMASFKGPELISNYLKSQVTNRIGKNSTFLNQKQLTKKEKRKEKKKQRKLLRKFGSMGQYEKLRNGDDYAGPVESVNVETQSPLELDIVNEETKAKSSILNGHFNVANGKLPSLKQGDASDTCSESGASEDDLNGFMPVNGEDDEVEFTTDGPQSSSFALALQKRYVCLNPDETTSSEHQDTPLISFTEEKSGNKCDSTLSSFLTAVSSGSSISSSESLLDVASPSQNSGVPSLVPSKEVKDKLGSKELVPSSEASTSKYLDLLQRREAPKESLKEFRAGSTSTVSSPIKDKDSKPVAKIHVSASSESKQEDGKSEIVVKLPTQLLPLSGKRQSEDEGNKKLIISAASPKIAKTSAFSPSLSSPSKVRHPDTPQLPVPRVVLFQREGIKPGWRLKTRVGCGLINAGNTCYLNSTLQVLMHTPALLNWLNEDRREGGHRNRCAKMNATNNYSNCLICPMENLAAKMYDGSQTVLRPDQIYLKLRCKGRIREKGYEFLISAIGKTLHLGRQEDAHEFLRLLLEAMERSYLTAINANKLDSRSKETTPLGQIFGGYTRGQVKCLTCGHVSTTFHPHAELQLDIRQVSNVQEGLECYFKKERLNNDYKCEKCKTVQPATKQQFMELAPIVLCIQLKRFRVDGSKMKKPIRINQHLNLRPFMFDKSKDITYRLVGVVNHMGSSPHCGHYTAIAQASNGQFYNFDDSYVNACGLGRIPETDVYVLIYEIVDQNARISETVSPANHDSKVPTPSKMLPKLTNGSSNPFRIPVRTDAQNIPQKPRILSSPSSSSTSANGSNTFQKSPSFTRRFLDSGNSSHQFISKASNSGNEEKPLPREPKPFIKSDSISSRKEEPHTHSPEAKVDFPNSPKIIPEDKLKQTKLPFAFGGTKVTSWDDKRGSTLGSLLEADKKRPLMKTKEELEDEAIDSGRVKKVKKAADTTVVGGSTRINPFDEINKWQRPYHS